MSAKYASKSEEVLGWNRRHVWHPFTQAQTMDDPIPIESASGTFLKTIDGREIADMISSWWVNVFGHGHPKIVAAVQEQTAKLEQVIFAGFTHQPAAELAKRLSEVLPGDLNRVFFSDDGSTSVEVAIKAAYQYWANQGETQRTRLIAFQGGYHGDTFGAMAAGRASGFFEHWKELLFPVDFLEPPSTWKGDGDREEKEQAALAEFKSLLEKQAGQTFALILEPLVQGAGGMRMVTETFLQDLVRIAKEHQVLVIFDEVMTGFGRTGARFAMEKAEVLPDIVCLSKGLTGGFLPLSVTVVRDEIYDAFLSDSFNQAFAHGHSFTANPIGCAAALASIDILNENETLKNWQRIEQAHREGMEQVENNPLAKHFRISGTIGAFDIEVGDEGYNSSVAPRLKRHFLEQGLLIRPLGNVVYLMPPYCTDTDLILKSWRAIDDALTKIIG